MKSILKTDSVV